MKSYMIFYVLLLSLMSFAAPSYAIGLGKSLKIGPSDRPASVKLPTKYSGKKQWPLILALHGRGATAELIDLYLGFSLNQDKLGYVTIIPQDPKRIYVIGHSNGGYMAYRLACDTDGLFSGVVSIAGSTFADESLCKTETPINILQIHGTEDSLVNYYGIDSDAPGAIEIVERWAERNECLSVQEFPRSKNLIFFKFEPGLSDNGRPTIIGDFKDFVTYSFKKETDELLWQDCRNGVRSGLWTINGSDHGPLFLGRNLIKQSLDFLEGK